MKRSAISRVTGIIVAAVILVACGSSSNGSAVPGAGSGLQSASNGIVDATTAQNLSGEYAGKVKDNVYGSGTASAFYAQYGNSLGGGLKLAFKTTTIILSVALTVSGNTTRGSTAGGLGSDYCTSSTKSKYNKKTDVVSGSYATVYGCTGEKGTFSLKQQCYFKGIGPQDIRPEAGSIKPC